MLKFKYPLLLIASMVYLAPAGQAQTCYQNAVRQFHQKKYNQALGNFYQHLQANPNDANGYYYAALSCHYLGKTNQAMTYYKKVLKLAPGSSVGKKARTIVAKYDPKFVASLKSRQGNTSNRSSSRSSRSRRSSSSTRSTKNDRLPDQARVFFRLEGSQMIVKGRINGREIDMLFDTGAPAAGYFSVQHLKELGLRQRKNASGKIGGSSNLKKVAFWNYDVDMQVGSIVRRGIRIMVLNNKRDTPLLGQEFFKGYTYTIDYGGKSIHFTKEKHSKGYVRAGRNSVPFKFRKAGNRVIVEMEINGRKQPAMFDTGHTTDAVLALTGRLQAKRLNIRIPHNAAVATTSGTSGSGTSRIVYVRKIKLGPIEQYNARVHVSDEEKGPEKLPLLGQAFYKDWQYTIDMKNKLIHFKRR